MEKKCIASYFPHDSNARNSDKLIRLRMRHKAAGYGVYFMILERLREEPEYMSVKDYNMIAFDLREDASLIKSVVEDFGLFVFTEDGKYFYSESFKQRMSVKDEKAKKRSEAGGKSAAQKWGNTERENLSPSELRSKRLSIAREKGTHTNEEWEELKDFFGECVICGSKERIVKDHIVPIYQGGSDAITNLQPLCNSCNSRKGSDNKDYRTEWCKSRNIEMPDKWLTKTEKWLTSKEKESKEKKSIEKDNKLSSPLSPQGEGGGDYLYSNLSRRDGIPRNLEGLCFELTRLGISQKEQDQIIKASNYGQIGHPVWPLIRQCADSIGKSTFDKSRIKMPGRYILSKLKEEREKPKEEPPHE